MQEIINRAAAKSIEMVVAGLKRPELRQGTQVPLSDKCCAVTCLLQKRGQRWMIRRQADVLSGRAGDRLFEADRQA
jgi:hypothetical protein